MKIKLLGNQYLPEYKTCGAAGADLHARGDYNILPGETLFIPLGVCFEIPFGYEIQIRPRSGLSSKGIELKNSPATIDSDYRGEVKAIIKNTTDKIFPVRDGDRIAQMIYSPVVQAEFEIADDLSETKRGAHGFGSTGI
jgi:dUTP pyrophosphatase